jgi:hypothetical protein
MELDTEGSAREGNETVGSAEVGLTSAIGAELVRRRRRCFCHHVDNKHTPETAKLGLIGMADLKMKGG